MKYGYIRKEKEQLKLQSKKKNEREIIKEKECFIFIL